MTAQQIEAIKDLIRKEVQSRSVVTFRDLFGRQTNYADWTATPLEFLYDKYGDEVAAQKGGGFLKEVLMEEQKGKWEQIKQSFANRRDNNEVSVYFRVR